MNDKLYIFYIKGPFLNECLRDYIIEEINYVKNQSTGQNGSYVYGWTTDKKIAREFCQYRNMERFVKVVRVIDESNSEQFLEFKKTHMYSQLSKASISTRSDRINADSDIKYCDVDMVISLFESRHIQAVLEGSDDWFLDCADVSDFVLVILTCMKKKYKDLLLDLGIFNYIQFVKNFYEGEYAPCILDELYVLFDYFGETFLIGGKE